MRPDAINWSDKHHNRGVAFLPRQSMDQRLWRWVVLLMLAQVGVTAVVLVALQGPWRQQTRLDYGPALTQLAADQLATAPIDADDDAVHKELQRLTSEYAVAFAAIIDDQNDIVLAAGSDAAAWQRHGEAADSEAGEPVPMRRLKSVDAAQGMLVYEAPIPRSEDEPRHRLILGMRDLGARRALLDGSVALATGLLVVMLVLFPIARRMLRRWTVGLQRVQVAIRRLAQGAEPRPLPAGGSDEVGYLALAFNEMATQLQASRRELYEANQELERRVAQRTEQLRQANREMEKLASSDALTGLANRRALASQMEPMFNLARRTGEDLVCMVIDLDGFKPINDTLGHSSGDEVLILAAEVFRSACRPTDLVARMGGDEFILLMPATTLEQVEPIAQRLLEKFRRRCAERFADADPPISPSLSIGIASRHQTSAASAEHLLQAADSALYQAKNAGKARIMLWQAPEQPAGTGASVES